MIAPTDDTTTQDDRDIAPSLVLHAGDACRESWEFSCYECGDLIARSCTASGHITLDDAIERARDAGWRFKDDNPQRGWRCPYHALWDLQPPIMPQLRRVS